MAHKFDPDKMDVLDTEERKKELPPKESLLKLGLNPGDTAADIGCGTGFLTFPASELVGRNGTIYAVDSSRQMLTELERRVKERGSENIEPVFSTEYDFTLPAESCHVVFMSNVFHEVDDKIRFAKEAYRILKRGGKFAVFEMKPDAEGCGPPKHHRVKPADVKKFLEAASFTSVKEMAVSGKIYSVIGYR